MEEKNLRKIGTEKEIKHKFGKITVGTIDKKDCKSIYLKLSTWITPSGYLSESIDKIKRRIRANMFKIGNTYLDNFGTYIVDFEFNQTHAKDKPLKKSYIAVEITLFPSDSRFEYDNDMIFTLQNMGDTIFELINTIDDFDLAATKK